MLLLHGFVFLGTRQQTLDIYTYILLYCLLQTNLPEALSTAYTAIC